MSNEKEKLPDAKGNFEQIMITCPKCNGTGTTNFPGQKRAATCQTCKGKGKIPA